MEMNMTCWIALGLFAAVYGAVMFSLGTRASVGDNSCNLKIHWWFGWWASCRGDCPNGGHDCALQYRTKGSNEQWQDENTRGKKYDDTKEYRCVCRPAI